MRILKYIFLLVLLSLVALSIFVATQKGDFIVERSKVINSPKSAVFNYVNDFRNWEDFGSWITENPETKINYSQNTVGNGALYSWEGKNGNGDMQTLFVKENDSISQKMNYNGVNSEVYWYFKDTIGGTKVTWKTEGKMSFLSKIYTAFNGSVEKMIGKIHEKSLANLDRRLDYEINTFNIKVNGSTAKSEKFYLAQSFTSDLSKINKNAQIVFNKIIGFCKKNNLTLNGNPFVIYHTFDKVNKLAKASFCVPIKEQIYTSSGSDILSGKLESFQAIKTTLTGDYSHREKALDKTTQYLNTNRIAPAALFSHLEIYLVDKNKIKNPSQWITEIYVPIRSKSAVVKSQIPTPRTEEITNPKTDEETQSEF